MVFVRNQEKKRKKMQDRLTEEEIEGLLREWKDHGRMTLTGVPIGDYQEGSSGGSSGGEEELNLNHHPAHHGHSKRRFQKDKNKEYDNQIIVESMYGSKMEVRLENRFSTTTTSTADTTAATSSTTITALNFATFDFLGMSCPVLPNNNYKNDNISKQHGSNNGSNNTNNSTATEVTPPRDNQKKKSKISSGFIKMSKHNKSNLSTTTTTTSTTHSNNNPSTSTTTNNNNDPQSSPSPTHKNLQNDPIKEASIQALTKYGCGSCGPRGFYGTIDAHLHLENAMSTFLQTDNAILYSDGAAASTSTVAAFAKRGDLLVVDEGIYEALGTGVILSRANVKYFRHNDMDDLRNVLERIQATDERLHRKKNDQRRFIVVEALYKNYGTLCPLKELLKLKEEFSYRLILDESFSFGSLGKTGRGALEYFGLEPMRHAEIVTFSLENSMGSVGGMTVGDEEVVDHQRLSGAGYCFSASLPPFLATAAEASLKKMQEEPELLDVLRENVVYAYEEMEKALVGVIPNKIRITSEDCISPIMYLQFAANEDGDDNDDDGKEILLSREDQIDLFDRIASTCLENGLFIVSTGRHVYEHLHKVPPPSIRMTIQAKHSKDDIDTAINILKKAIEAVL